MQGSFEYFYEKRVNAQLDVEDIGKCALEAFNDLGCVYYLTISTQLGISIITEAGPYAVDINALPKSCNIKYSRINFTDKKLKDIISKFLNDPFKNITQAQEITKEVAYANCIDILDYVKHNKDFV